MTSEVIIDYFLAKYSTDQSVDWSGFCIAPAKWSFGHKNKVQTGQGVWTFGGAQWTKRMDSRFSFARYNYVSFRLKIENLVVILDE